MALVIKWTLQAEKGLDNVIKYLEAEWTTKEILNLETKINQVIKQIILIPDLFPKSQNNPKLHKAIVDKNNYMVYKVNIKTNSISIINFRGTKQKAKY